MEEMTLLSKIIRFDNPESSKEMFRTIEIKDLFTHQSTENIEVTPESLFEERERLLDNARQEIEREREMFEQFRLVAQQEIEDAKANWEQEKMELQQQAYEEGFQQGIEEGRLKAESNMSEAIQLANDTVLQAKSHAQQYLQEQEAVILNIAINAAEKILGTVLEENEERYMDIVRRGLKEAREMKEIKIYTSLAYYELVSAHIDELKAMFPVGVPVMVFVDEDLANTDSYIETNHGRIMVGIDQQLNELRLKLVEILESVD